MASAKFRVLELFSGIGGMHLALKWLGIDYNIVAAVEINDMSNKVYRQNFPGTNLLQKNIEGLTVQKILKLSPNMILMSPPCQPFTRSGLKQDVGDKRCMPLLHLLEILPELSCIDYILLENVVGFENSEARDQVVDCLKKIGFVIQEYHLCPTQLNIPNRRPRYYLLAKREPLCFKFAVPQSSQELQLALPLAEAEGKPVSENFSQWHQMVTSRSDDPKKCFKLELILEKTDNQEDAVQEKDLRFFTEFDLVGRDSRLSSCFTKSYKRYFLGTGSVFVENLNGVSNLDTSMPDLTKVLYEQFKPRFFTTREILRLMCFPEWYTFPSEISKKQAAAVLGNSINVHVVALLIGLLTE